jgi:hypothetical protein
MEEAMGQGVIDFEVPHFDDLAVGLADFEVDPGHEQGNGKAKEQDSLKITGDMLSHGPVLTDPQEALEFQADGRGILDGRWDHTLIEGPNPGGRCKDFGLVMPADGAVKMLTMKFGVECIP